MNYKIEHLFSSPIYASKVNDTEVVNYEIDKIIDKVDFHFKQHSHFLSTFDFEENILERYKIKYLSKEIDRHLRKYCDELGFKTRDYKLVSWFSKFEPKNYAHMHHHGHADISGCYYYKTNEVDGSIFFKSPNPHLGTSECYSKVNNTWIHPPAIGKIILFPGWLLHGVKINETHNTRISVSFNIFFKYHK